MKKLIIDGIESVGDLLKVNNGLLNYVYDRYGFIVGAVVAIKGDSRHHPALGYALIDEVPDVKYIYHKTLRELPVQYESYRYIKSKLRTAYEMIEDEAAKDCISDAFEEINSLFNEEVFTEEDSGSIIEPVLTREQKLLLVKTAMERVNMDSWSYFSNRDPEYHQNLADLREDKIQYYYSSCDEEVEFTSPALAKLFRDTIRKTEYRAFRYYKDIK